MNDKDKVNFEKTKIYSVNGYFQKQELKRIDRKNKDKLKENFLASEKKFFKKLKEAYTDNASLINNTEKTLKKNQIIEKILSNSSKPLTREEIRKIWKSFYYSNIKKDNLSKIFKVSERAREEFYDDIRNLDAGAGVDLKGTQKEAVRESLNKLPQKILKEISEKGRLRFIKQIESELLGKKPNFITSLEELFEDTKGAYYSYVEDKAYAGYSFSPIIVEIKELNNNNLPIRTLIHEVGHFIYYFLMPRYYMDEEKVQIKNLYKKRIEEIEEEGKFISNYSKTNESEFFAEAIAYYYNNPDTLKKTDLELYFLIKQIITKFD